MEPNTSFTQGAEPLYLHILRPLIKPYVDTVDPLLDLTRDIGDFLFALSQVPLNYVLSLSGLPWHTEENESAAESLETSASRTSTMRFSSNIPTAAKIYASVESNPLVMEKRPASIHSVTADRIPRRRPVDSYESTGGRRSKSASVTTLSHYPSNTVGRVNARPVSNNPRKAVYEIWHPPPPAYEEEPRRSRLSVGQSGIGNASTPDLIQPGTPPPAVLLTEPTAVHSEDWRLYPAFPSAYPPTPLPAAHSLPGTTPSGQNDPLPARVTTIAPIPEDTINRSQDFDVSHEYARHNSSSNSSDESSDLSGAHAGLERSRSSDQRGIIGNQDESDEIEDEEDDFDVTLRTPYRSSVASNASSSVASLPSVLTTNDNASSLRTMSSSESIHSYDSSAHAGRKRSYPSVTVKGRAAIVAMPKNTTIVGKAATATSYKNDLDSGASDSGDHGHDTDSDNTGAGAKRRKVLEPIRRSTHLRPTAKSATNVRRPALATKNPLGPSRGKVFTPAHRTRNRGSSRGASQTVRVASREDTLIPTRRSTSKMPSQDVGTYSRTGTIRNKA